MGNVCLSRDENPDEDFKLYEKYKKLQEEVCATLGNRERFGHECGESYRAACQRCGVQLLDKKLMTEMTRNFLEKLSCDDDPRMVSRIYMSLEKQFPTEDAHIAEAPFKAFIQDVLVQIDRDISEKLRKLESKYPGVRDATTVQYNEDEQRAIDEGYPQGYSRGGAKTSQMQDQQLALLEEEERRHKEWKRHQEQLRAEEQRLRQASRDPNEMNATYDGQQGQRQEQQLQMQQQQRAGLSSLEPPPTQPQAQPPLSAAQLQRLQNSLAQQAQGRPPPTQQVNPPASASMPPPGYQQPYARAAPPSPLTPTLPGAPPPTVVQPTAQPLPEYRQEDVDRMKSQITSSTDGLKVQVYNQHLQLEPKRLSLNLTLNKIGIFDVGEGGLGYPTAFFDIPDLKCITQGISSSIMEAPPRAEVALGFRFSQEPSDGAADKDRSQDKFLCFVFDAPEMCLLAGEAFSQLCGVPVAPAV